MGVANFVGLQILFKDEVSDVELDRIVNEAMKILDGGIFRQK
jgi:hypothetical protein